MLSIEKKTTEWTRRTLVSLSSFQSGVVGGMTVIQADTESQTIYTKEEKGVYILHYKRSSSTNRPYTNLSKFQTKDTSRNIYISHNDYIDLYKHRTIIRSPTGLHSASKTHLSNQGREKENEATDAVCPPKSRGKPKRNCNQSENQIKITARTNEFAIFRKNQWTRVSAEKENRILIFLAKWISIIVHDELTMRLT